MEVLTHSRHTPRGRDLVEPPHPALGAVTLVDEVAAQCVAEPALAGPEFSAKLAGTGRRGLRGRGRCCGAMVCGEVGDGDVGLVTDTGNHRHRAGADGPGDGLIVEGHEILEGPTTAHQQHDLDAARASGPSQGGHDGLRRPVALHRGGREHHVDARRTTTHDGDDIVKGGPGARCHHRNSRREQRQSPLEAFVEETLCEERPLALLNGQSQRSHPARLQAIDHQLVATLLRVQADLPMGDDCHAVLGSEGNAHRVGAKADTGQSRGAVLHREVDVA